MLSEIASSPNFVGAFDSVDSSCGLWSFNILYSCSRPGFVFAMLALAFAAGASLPTIVLGQVSPIVIRRRHVNCLRGHQSLLRLLKLSIGRRRIYENRCDVLAEFFWVRAGLIRKVLATVTTACETRQRDVQFACVRAICLLIARPSFCKLCQCLC